MLLLLRLQQPKWIRSVGGERVWFCGGKRRRIDFLGSGNFEGYGIWVCFLMSGSRVCRTCKKLHEEAKNSTDLPCCSNFLSWWTKGIFCTLCFLYEFLKFVDNFSKFEKCIWFVWSVESGTRLYWIFGAWPDRSEKSIKMENFLHWWYCIQFISAQLI